MVRGLKRSKTHITVFVKLNAHGSNKRQAMLVGQKYPSGAKINSDKRSIRYHRNEKPGYYPVIRTSIFVILTTTWGPKVVRSYSLPVMHLHIQNQKVLRRVMKDLLVLDHVKLPYLPPNTTAWVEQLGASIIGALKSGYRHRFAQYIVNYFEGFDTLVPRLDVLQVMYIIANTRGGLTRMVFHCWQKVGLSES